MSFNIIQDILLAEQIGAELVLDYQQISTGATTALPPFDITLNGNKFSINITLNPVNGGVAGMIPVPNGLQKFLQELSLTAQIGTEIIADVEELAVDQQTTLPVFYVTLSGYKFGVTLVATPLSEQPTEVPAPTEQPTPPVE